MLVGPASGIEFLLHLGQQEKRLFHRVGDEKDIDQVELGQWRIEVQELLS